MWENDQQCANKCALWNSSVTSPSSQFILQPFCCFTYITAHSPTLLLLLLASHPFSRGVFLMQSITSTLEFVLFVAIWQQAAQIPVLMWWVALEMHLYQQYKYRWSSKGLWQWCLICNINLLGQKHSPSVAWFAHPCTKPFIAWSDCVYVIE